MRNLIKMELKKAFVNPFFFIALGVGVVICCGDAIESNSKWSYYAILEELNAEGGEPIGLPSCFSMWMSVYGNTSWCTVFYLIAPLLAVVPYGCSLATERRGGYVGQVYTRVTRWRYLLAKSIASFIVGGTVVVVPQLMNLALVATASPAWVPVVTDAVSTGIYNDNLWASWFYEVPGLYVAAYCVLDFVLCGIWTVFVTMLGCLTTNRVAVLVVPYVAIYIVQFLNERIFMALGGIRGFQLSMFENLHAYTSQYVQNGWIIAGEVLFLALLACLLVRYGSKKDEL